MASVGFRWLDILEKEFDKTFVDLDLSIGELDSEEPDVVFNVRQKLCSLSSCFAQLTHKAQTIFQNSAKIEAELIHMRAELVESKTKRDVLEQELHNLLLQLHSSQLAQIPEQKIKRRPDSLFKPDVNSIKKRFDAELLQSPIRITRSKEDVELKFGGNYKDSAQLRAENAQLACENANLRHTILSLNSEVYGAKLAAKYLDKELAGRIQQLQLLGREMRGDVRDKVWRQLESEILLQRHKTVVRACRRNNLLPGQKTIKMADIDDRTEHFGDIRTVIVKRSPSQGLGISITGGREHGVPILISELETNGPAAISEQLYIGDAILSINEKDLRQACHREAVDILQQQTGDCTFEVQYIAADDSDASLEDEGYNFRFFEGETHQVCENGIKSKNTLEVVNTPTAPRTPESNSPASRLIATFSPQKSVERLKTDLSNLLIVDNRQKTDNFETNTPTHTQTDINKNGGDFQKPSTILFDNATNHIIKLAEFKKVDLPELDDNLNCSTASLASESLSSPMQTSADACLDSEAGSSPAAAAPAGRSSSSESLSRARSDRSLLNSSGGSSPACRRRPRRRYFGVRTLQGLFNRQPADGYSDVSTTASEVGEERAASPAPAPADPSPQFEENLHSFLAELFVRNVAPEGPPAPRPAVGSRKYFSLHGQNLRVGKALRLCPNEDFGDQVENEQRKEKLLARYVYNANSIGADGVGDPDFGTPV